MEIAVVYQTGKGSAIRKNHLCDEDGVKTCGKKQSNNDRTAENELMERQSWLFFHSHLLGGF